MRLALHRSLLGLVLSVTAAHADLGTTFQQTGNLALEVTAVAGGNSVVAGGTMVLSRLPATATVVKATLYASQINNGVGLHATFAGNNLGTVGPAASDSENNVFYAYQWDVTARLVPGVTFYTYSVNGGNTIAGVALAVVWEDINEPTRMVAIVDGMLQVGENGAETESADIENLGHGATKVSIFTVLDDTINTGETVAYNDSIIGGPIDRNLGVLASLLELDCDSFTGTNRLSIWTDTDHMGWMIAGVEVTMPPVSLSRSTWSGVKALYR
ncbi:MAG TPA: hypothetical protein VFD07_04650 [Candidatus Krumholzibacteria bacterium]|nr:hypothetical protein [Candidatus Krumholzibacteria bacterium]